VSITIAYPIETTTVTDRLAQEIRASAAGVPLPVKATRVNSIAQRAERLAFAAACAAHQQDVIDFWYKTMMDDRVEMQHRITCSVHLMDRAYGKTVQVTQENVTENRKQILEVRWLAPDPNDHSKLIEPEPD
jgi:hypothetical protein